MAIMNELLSDKDPRLHITPFELLRELLCYEREFSDLDIVKMIYEELTKARVRGGLNGKEEES